MEDDELIETNAPVSNQDAETDITADPVPDNPASDPVTEEAPTDTPAADAGEQTDGQAAADAGDQTDGQAAADAGDQTEGQTPAAEETESGEQSGGTTVINVRPPAQITYQYQIDADATYHVDVQNDEASPVPVLVTETLIEKEPGIMDKRLEDYTVTEGLLLLILLVLALRFVVDLGRRIF